MTAVPMSIPPHDATPAGVPAMAREARDGQAATAANDGSDAAIERGAALSDAAVCALTADVVSGERRAYERLFRLRCVFVERESLRRLSRRRDLAPDAAQETWLRVARAPRCCESISRLDAWLQRIVASAAVDLLRSELARRVREDRLAASRNEASAFVDDVELLEAMGREMRRLDGLDGEERALLELRTRTGATLAQLGAMLGVGRAAVDSRLRRAAESARRVLTAEAVQDRRGER
jgi:RNA polymerase sigma factor (sigma-70 family)